MEPQKMKKTTKPAVKKSSTAKKGAAGKTVKSKTASAPAKKAAAKTTSKAGAAKAKAKAAQAKAQAQEEDDIEEAAAGVGHNGGPALGVAGDQLRKAIERVERLEEEKKEIAEDIKEVYAGAKAVGFDVKIMRKVVARRKMDRATLQEEEALIDTYESALG